MSVQTHDQLDNYIAEMQFNTRVLEALEHRGKIQKMQLQLVYLNVLWREASPSQRRKFRKGFRSMKTELKSRIRKLKRELP